ncbi:hypothetical protein [Winogradskyella endarachnes]|uniref:Uncharacterized protein n=1 Tax=Winogradskyella endarachnes TaxID=2681965 RepID=A0A6L6UAX6_9FLAO|nr:hypothetical protein [Winogradskyella endarachnes]MUU78062.1 hypothetical protein [Winogradskyella endarachnes]
MNRFLAILSFYKPFVVWSFIATTICAFFSTHLIPAIVTKLFLTVFAWYYMNETNNKRKLTFYQNLGISTFKLFSVVFIVDCFLTVIFLTLFSEFT